jgi:hypothetical protein
LLRNKLKREKKHKEEEAEREKKHRAKIDALIET